MMKISKRQELRTRTTNSPIITIGIFLAASLVLALPGTAKGEVKIRGFASSGFNLYNNRFTSFRELRVDNSILSFAKQSKFGLNLYSELTDKFSVTAQILGTYAETDLNFPLEVEWAFLRYAVTPTTDLRVGRLITSTWLYSDSVNVGYNLPWIHTPFAVYDLNPLTAMSGADAQYQMQTGLGRLALQVMAGSIEFNQASNTGNGFKQVAHGHGDIFLSTQAQLDFSDSLRIRTGYSQGHLALHSHFDAPLYVPGLCTAIPGIGTTCPTVTAEQSADFAKFYNLAIRYDDNRFLFISEFARRTISGTAVPEISAAYATAGYRHGKWLAHVTRADQFKMVGTSFLGPPSTTAPSASKTSSTEYSLGVNFQAADSVIIKSEIRRGTFVYNPTTSNISTWSGGMNVAVIF